MKKCGKEGFFPISLIPAVDLSGWVQVAAPFTADIQ
jgi:hypothetical protein